MAKASIGAGPGLDPSDAPVSPVSPVSPAPGGSQGKTRTLLLIFAILSSMIALVAASPTLYDLFCRVTGYGGTAANSLVVYERPLATISGLALHPDPYQVVVEAAVSGAAPIQFIAKQRKVEGFHIGQRVLLEFSVKNTSNQPIRAQAIHQIRPEVLAPYMQVQECFCTSEQVLEPGKLYEYALVMRFDPAALDVADALREGVIHVRYEYLEKS